MIDFNKPKVLIIGLGNIGMGYDIKNFESNKVLTHAKSFLISDQFSLVGGVDLDASKRKQFKERYNCPAFSNIEKAMRDLSPEIVVIATSTDNHLKNVRDVFSNGLPKILICEKPLAYNLLIPQKY